MYNYENLFGVPIVMSEGGTYDRRYFFMQEGGPAMYNPMGQYTMPQDLPKMQLGADLFTKMKQDLSHYG